MNSKTTIERALELAATGEFAKVTEIAGALRKERYANVDSNLSGGAIRRQLKTLILASRAVARGVASDRQAADGEATAHGA